MLNKLIVPISIVIAGFLVAGAIYLSKDAPTTTTGGGTTTTNDAAKKQAATGEPSQIDVTLNAVTDADHIMGNADAELVIVEYSDFECPFCSKFHKTMEQVMEEYGKDGKVAWVYRHYPLDFHPKAMPTAVASECVARIGGDVKFFEFAKKAFEGTSLDTATLASHAAAIGIDSKAYTDCLATDYGTKEVQADINDAAKIAQNAPGGFGTPYSIVIKKDGTKFVIEGAQPYFRVMQIIDTLLAK